MTTDDKVDAQLRRALVRYRLIEDGDRVLVAVSGGKDSLALLRLLALRSRIFKPKFSIVAAHVRMRNIPYRADAAYLQRLSDDLGVELRFIDTAFDATTDRRHTPCFLCSWHRRKALFALAQELGCNKIALGHHQDDVIQTALMGLTFTGSFSAMPPLLRMERFPITLIRPLCLMRERLLSDYAAEHGFQTTLRPCPYEDATRRHDIAQIAAQLEAMSPDFAASVQHALETVRQGRQEHGDESTTTLL